MHTATLDRLRCPTCHTPLRLSAAVEWLGLERVRRGAARCACTEYTIADGILDLRPSLRDITPAQASNHVPPTAWGYEDTWRKRALSLLSGEPFPIEREWRVVRDMLQPGDGLYVDLACSTALQARGLARFWRDTGGVADDTRIVAIDFSAPMLREAARRIRHEGGDRIDLVRARAERLPFADGVVAGLVCGGSLNEFAAPWPVLVEARRVIQPGGSAVFMSLLTTATQRGARVQRFLNSASGLKFWTPEATAALFADAGWQVVAQRVWGGVAFTHVRA